MNKEMIKKTLIYAGAILFFAIVAYSFVPQVFSGKIVNQSDISAPPCFGTSAPAL